MTAPPGGGRGTGPPRPLRGAGVLNSGAAEEDAAAECTGCRWAGAGERGTAVAVARSLPGSGGPPGRGGCAAPALRGSLAAGDCGWSWGGTAEGPAGCRAAAELCGAERAAALLGVRGGELMLVFLLMRGFKPGLDLS